MTQAQYWVEVRRQQQLRSAQRRINQAIDSENRRRQRAFDQAVAKAEQGAKRAIRGY